jgi:putative ABC transport system permease protein
MTLSMIEKTKRSDSGEISVYAKGYRLSKSILDNIKDSKAIEERLKSDKRVNAVALRLKADGLCATARKSSFATAIGVDLNAEEKFGKFSEFLKSGELKLGKHGALVGSELAKKMKLKIGSKVIFSAQDSHGEINAMALKVQGVIQTNNITLDASTVFVDVKTLRNFLGVSENEITQIAIRTDSLTLQETLQKEYAALEVKSFLELYPMMQQMQDVMIIFNSITFFIVMIVVFIGIMGVMYVSILDRIREFGVMKSVGMSYSLIRAQIILEALFVGLIGYAIGATFGFLALYYLKIYGLDMSAFADGLESFGYSSVMYATIKTSYFSSTFLAIMSSSILSVALPLRKIKTMNSIEATKVNI